MFNEYPDREDQYEEFLTLRGNFDIVNEQISRMVRDFEQLPGDGVRTNAEHHRKVLGNRKRSRGIRHASLASLHILRACQIIQRSQRDTTWAMPFGTRPGDPRTESRLLLEGRQLLEAGGYASLDIDEDGTRQVHEHLFSPFGRLINECQGENQGAVEVGEDGGVRGPTTAEYKDMGVYTQQVPPQSPFTVHSQESMDLGSDGEGQVKVGAGTYLDPIVLEADEQVVGWLRQRGSDCPRRSGSGSW